MQPGRKPRGGPRRKLPAVHIIGKGFQLQIQRGAQQACLNAVPVPGFLPVIHRAHDAKRSQYRAMLVDRRRTDRRRRVFAVPGQRGDPAHALDQQVLPRLFHLGPAGTIAGAGAVDQPRVDLFQRLVTQAQLFHNARAEIFKDHVILFYQPVNDLLPFPGFQVHRDRPLVAVSQQKKHTDAVFVGITARPASLVGAFC